MRVERDQDRETHPPGSRVCVQGDDTRDVMFVVMEGELEVEETSLADPRASAASGKTETKAIRLLQRGDVFGESRLFTGAPCGCLRSSSGAWYMTVPTLARRHSLSGAVKPKSAITRRATAVAWPAG